MRTIGLKHLPNVRLAFLALVNALIAYHIYAYYVLDQRSVGCVDFFGLATFAGKGQITAGTVFIGALILVTLLLGRIFCGWGCHFALFQDLLVRLFEKLRIRLPFRRSRLEWILPPVLFFVTLLYPIFAWWRHAGLPQSVAVDLAYPDVWHLLPGLKGVVLLLVVDVVVLTVLFGSRAFCRYVCPYGLFLKFFHALSPFRVVKAGDCTGCGTCTSVCPTGVPVKYEVEKFEVIHDLNCMNCGDCVAACPEGALALRPTRRAYTRGFEQTVTGSSQPMWAEAIMVTTAIAGLFLYRGREYGDFLAVAMGLGTGAAIVVALKPARFIPAGWARRLSMDKVRWATGVLSVYLLLGLVGQGVGTHALDRGRRALETNDYEGMLSALSGGTRIASVFQPFTFYLDDFHDRAGRKSDQNLAAAGRLLEAGSWRDAELVYRSVLSVQPDRIQAHGNLGTALLKQGRFWEAAGSYLMVLDYDPNDMVALYHLATTWIQLGNFDQAAGLVQQILAEDTVGNAYNLIQQNPLFQLLDQNPGYRRTMAAYRPQQMSNPLKKKGDPQ